MMLILFMRASFADEIVDRIRGKEEMTPSESHRVKAKKTELYDI